ncbi:hypothetical protein C8R44DRAFT_770251 [Mycena epipterygia]|nr:hypothetical protein C8R44DRAFT_770251 [Mycena epipterygia]
MPPRAPCDIFCLRPSWVLLLLISHSHINHALVPSPSCNSLLPVPLSCLTFALAHISPPLVLARWTRLATDALISSHLSVHYLLSRIVVRHCHFLLFFLNFEPASPVHSVRIALVALASFIRLVPPVG